MSMVLGLILARGGSKSVPRKNIKLLAGSPLIAYTIEAARQARLVDRLVVSTEDEEIAAVCAGLGAEAPFRRPLDLAGDSVTDLPVIQHALSELKRLEGYAPELVVHLRPTAPFRTAAHIDRGVEMLLEDPLADSVRSVTPAGQHPLKMWSLREDGFLKPYVPGAVFGIAEAYNMPRQALPKAYVQNGSVDVIRTATLLEKNSMTGDRIRALVMDELESINIDSTVDWELAEILMRRRIQAAAGQI